MKECKYCYQVKFNKQFPKEDPSFRVPRLLCKACESKIGRDNVESFNSYFFNNHAAGYMWSKKQREIIAKGNEELNK